MPIPKDYFLKFSLRGLAEPLTYQVDVESIKRLHQLFLSDPIEDSTPSFVEFEDVRGRMINVNMRHVTHALAFWDYHEANSEEHRGSRIRSSFTSTADLSLSPFWMRTRKNSNRQP